MLNLLKCTLIFIFFAGYSQNETTLYSVYLSSDKATGLKETGQIDKRYYHRYELNADENNVLRQAAGDQLVADATGLYLEKNKLLSISRTEVRENSKYAVRGGYLFGVVANDSLPVALEDELYYFLIPTKTYLYEADAYGNKIYAGLNSGEYLIITPEKNTKYYSCIYVRFNGNTVELLELNPESQAYDIGTVQKQRKDGESTFIITPSQKEWENIMRHCFLPYDAYVLLP